MGTLKFTWLGESDLMPTHVSNHVECEEFVSLDWDKNLLWFAMFRYDTNNYGWLVLSSHNPSVIYNISFDILLTKIALIFYQTTFVWIRSLWTLTKMANIDASYFSQSHSDFCTVVSKETADLENDLGISIYSSLSHSKCGYPQTGACWLSFWWPFSGSILKSSSLFTVPRKSRHLSVVPNLGLYRCTWCLESERGAWVPDHLWLSYPYRLRPLNRGNLIWIFKHIREYAQLHPLSLSFHHRASCQHDDPARKRLQGSSWSCVEFYLP